MPREHPLIAVVDDNTAIVDMLCECLVDEGYQVVSCCDGNEAQTLIRNVKPDLVILDIRLGLARSGWVVRELMRLVPATKDIPVIMCSTDMRFLRENEEQLRKQRCNILEKPFNLDTLLETVSAAVGTPPLGEREV